MLLRDPHHPMTPGHITEGASWCIQEMFLSKLHTGRAGDSEEETRWQPRTVWLITGETVGSLERQHPGQYGLAPQPVSFVRKNPNKLQKVL